MTDISEELIAQLKRHEGFRANFYRCSAGKRTIGYGRNVEANPTFDGWKITSPLSKQKAEAILKADIEDVIKKLSRSWYAFGLIKDDARREAFINMAFNLGVGGFMDFEKTRFYAERGEWDKCAEQMLKSKWAEQVGDRAKELAKQVRTGVYQ
jgi:lysozyme